VVPRDLSLSQINLGNRSFSLCFIWWETGTRRGDCRGCAWWSTAIRRYWSMSLAQTPASDFFRIQGGDPPIEFDWCVYSGLSWGYLKHAAEQDHKLSGLSLSSSPWLNSDYSLRTKTIPILTSPMTFNTTTIYLRSPQPERYLLCSAEVDVLWHLSPQYCPHLHISQRPKQRIIQPLTQGLLL